METSPGINARRPKLYLHDPPLRNKTLRFVGDARFIPPLVVWKSLNDLVESSTCGDFMADL
jgi:hypothetical protein